MTAEEEVQELAAMLPQKAPDGETKCTHGCTCWKPTLRVVHELARKKI